MKPCSPAPNEISNIPVAAIPKPVYRIKLAGLGKNDIDVVVVDFGPWV